MSIAVNAVEPAIRLSGLTKVFPGSGAPAVDGLSLDVPRGSTMVLVGPSGCGKTTTLKMINRLIEPTAGTIEVDGRDVTNLPAHELRRGIGFVIQQIGLFPHRTIEANIATVPKLLGWDKSRISSRVQELVEVVGLDRSVLKRYPPELSGGQQQRVGVARALAADPPVLLMDEPYSAVDPIVRGRLQDDLLALQGELHKTIVLVSHDIDEAIKLGDRVCVLNVGGIVEQVARPADLLAAPVNEFVAEFLGTDRGLRRLALLTVDELELKRGPVVERTAGGDEARAAMARAGTDWFGIVEDERLVGWAPSSGLDGRASLAEVETRRFSAGVYGHDTLRTTLDRIVSSDTFVAIVEDADGRYRGMVTIEQIGRGSRA
ncbi:MAG: ABC transporter ATP-binding protein [Actinomycetota bacterium]